MLKRWFKPLRVWYTKGKPPLDGQALSVTKVPRPLRLVPGGRGDRAKTDNSTDSVMLLKTPFGEWHYFKSTEKLVYSALTPPNPKPLFIDEYSVDSFRDAAKTIVKYDEYLTYYSYKPKDENNG